MKLIPLLITLVLACGSLNAQSRAESNLYNKTINKPSLKAYDNFLKRYPGSIYSADILARKDTLLNISPFSEAEAKQIASSFVSENSSMVAFAQRREAIDRIYAISVASPEFSENLVRIQTLELEKGQWKLIGSYDTPNSIADIEASGLSQAAICDSTSRFKIRGEDYFQFCYHSASQVSNAHYYTAAAYCPVKETLDQVLFIGKDREDGIIEGRIDQIASISDDKSEKRVLAAILHNNPKLEHISQADYLSDMAVEWWLEHNPSALVDAKKVNINILPEDASLVESFNSSRTKINSAKYSAILADIRGYTLIIVRQKVDGQFLLAWAEPECKDHYNDRLLNSIHFIDSNTLELQYYHGRKTYKYRLNLATKTLKR